MFEIVSKKATNTKRATKVKYDEARILHASKISKEDKIRALNKAPDKLTVAQLRILFDPLKHQGDK